MSVVLVSFPVLSLGLVTLGIIGLWRWGLWLFRTLVAILLYDPVDGDVPDLDVSVIIPVYKEDPEALRAALETYAANDPAEILAVIDSSDKECIEVFKSFANAHESARLIVTDLPGKRGALRRGARKATGDIIALVDSDVHWKKNTKKEFLKPFADPDVGGVAPNQILSEHETLSQRLYEATQRIRFATEAPALSVTAGALSVVSGRTAVYRREAIVDVLKNIEKETFRKQTVISGEDKFLTREVHAAGWDTLYQATSVIRINGARSLRTLFAQVVRWRRNSIRSDLRSLSSRWVYRRPSLAYFMADRFVAPFAAMLAPIYMITLVLEGLSILPVRSGPTSVWVLAGLIIIWWLISRSIKLHPYLRRYKRIDVVVPYILWTFAMIPVQIFGMLTATNQGWLTRGEDSRFKISAYRNRMRTRLALAIVAAIVCGYSYLVIVIF